MVQVVGVLGGRVLLILGGQGGRLVAVRPVCGLQEPVSELDKVLSVHVQVSTGI